MREERISGANRDENSGRAAASQTATHYLFILFIYELAGRRRRIVILHYTIAVTNASRHASCHYVPHSRIYYLQLHLGQAGSLSACFIDFIFREQKENTWVDKYFSNVMSLYFYISITRIV